jgi:hypothetical protein
MLGDKIDTEFLKGWRYWDDVVLYVKPFSVPYIICWFSTFLLEGSPWATWKCVSSHLYERLDNQPATREEWKTASDSVKELNALHVDVRINDLSLLLCCALSIDYSRILHRGIINSPLRMTNIEVAWGLRRNVSLLMVNQKYPGGGTAFIFPRLSWVSRIQWSRASL